MTVDIAPENTARVLALLDEAKWFDSARDEFIAWARQAVPALVARLAEVTLHRDELDFLLNEGGEDSVARLISRAEAAEARVTELEALLAAYQDQTVPDLTAVYLAGGMDRRDEVERLRAANLIMKLGLEDIGICGTIQPKNQTLMKNWHERVAQLMRDQAHDVLERAHCAALAAPQPTATKETKDE